MKITKEELRQIIKEEVKAINEYGEEKLPADDELLSLVGELREFIVNKDYENKAFVDKVIDKMYFTIYDSYDEVRRVRLKRL